MWKPLDDDCGRGGGLWWWGGVFKSVCILHSSPTWTFFPLRRLKHIWGNSVSPLNIFSSYIVFWCVLPWLLSRGQLWFSVTVTCCFQASSCMIQSGYDCCFHACCDGVLRDIQSCYNSLSSGQLWFSVTVICCFQVSRCGIQRGYDYFFRVCCDTVLCDIQVIVFCMTSRCKCSAWRSDDSVLCVNQVIVFCMTSRWQCSAWHTEWLWLVSRYAAMVFCMTSKVATTAAAPATSPSRHQRLYAVQGSSTNCSLTSSAVEEGDQSQRCFLWPLNEPQWQLWDLKYSALASRSQIWTPQWGAADAEIKVPSDEITELKRSPFKAWSRSVYSHTCYAYCQGFLPCLWTFWSIHLHFLQNLSWFFPVLAVANTGPQNKIRHPVGAGSCVECPWNISGLKKHDLWYDDLWNE